MARPIRRIVLLTAAFAALAAGAAPSSAFADAFDDVFRDYQRDGRIEPCDHSEAVLKQAKAQVPNDIEQYAPDFPDALEAALEERARGGCRKNAPGTPGSGEDGGGAPTAPGAAGAGGGGGAAAPGVPDGGQPAGHGDAGGTPAPPGAQQPVGTARDGAIARAAAPGPRTSDADAPVPLIALAIIGGLLLLALLAWAVARWLALSPRWAVSTRHAIGEAGWRTSGAWSEFADWVRTRRGPSQTT